MNELNTGINMPEEVEVDLASPKSRILAVIINNIINILVYVPLIMFFVQAMEQGYFQRASGQMGEIAPMQDFTLLIAGVAVILIYGAVQVYFMSRDGQSLGKKIMGIRVLKTSGSNPGFWGTVAIREIAYGFLLGLASVGAGMLGLMVGGESVGDILSNLVQIGAMTACVVMLFQVKNDRRTLQDLLANTVVVKLPKK